MKHILITTIATVLLVGCGESTPDISIHDAASSGNIEAVKQHIADGTDVNAKGSAGWTPLYKAAFSRSQGNRRTAHRRRCGCECELSWEYCFMQCNY